MVKRSEWTEAQGVRLAGLLRGNPGDPGRTGAATRVCVSAVLWGAARGGPLARPAVALRAVEVGAPACHPLGQSGRVGAGGQCPDDGARHCISDARPPPRVCASAGGPGKRGGAGTRR